MLRFVLLAVPLAVLVLALSTFAADLAGLGPDLSPLAAQGLARAGGLPRGVGAAAFAFEAMALTALYLMIEGRFGRWWLDGLASGLVAWLFRGPILVLAVAALVAVPTAPLWEAARVALFADPAATIALAALARVSRPR